MEMRLNYWGEGSIQVLLVTLVALRTEFFQEAIKLVIEDILKVLM